ncbi:inositol monophosphatase [Sediminibacterium sp.]|uniref:inositol monophosphatase family protein n=1 Tax=Sediminibacterium sp. TaxID=1917865 RepID=UPI0025EBC225|nr:inositol monophosphatase [Sediminibacterium sp.]MBT9485460.1 inositol monophosphatase [Sediminibacterium sp.]
MLTQQHIDIVLHALDKARDVALTYFDNPGILTNELKDIKTLVDLKMNECILNELSSTGFPIISEESDWKHKAVPQSGWIVDPLDGTLNFTRKFPCVGISIAFMVDGIPTHGFVKDIFNNITYAANLNEGATKNGIAMNVSGESQLNNAILSTGFPSGANYDTSALMHFVSNVQEFKKIRALGSASLMLCLVAEGVFDVYHEKGIYLWDVAAGIALVKASGGKYLLTKMDDPYKYEVLASNSGIFEKALQKLTANR